ncbi:unnamed protein product [Kuraishia capsulata CBS 1993]|uniref:General transcription and DNA repair factor IIH n=1 Tax=Kuraishia capsulata CBS 1993 TaxID=1382522 RepID=W6MU97_9ASCO|nr:uncharacterized protein KUCA_T00005003001 [Kuraishia capsulata CBS 1993]CDK29017.1 unnamed protein product [Kuraishia capsulata CBS 1993]
MDSDEEFGTSLSPEELSDDAIEVADDASTPVAGISNRTRKKTVKKVNQVELMGQSGGYSWEDEYRRSWDIVQEDESGSIESIVSGLVEAHKKRLLKNVTPFQRGIIRTLVLVLDFSKVMSEKDLRPSRASLMLSYAIDFINEFFDQNPISQIGVVIMRNGLAQLVSEVSGNPFDHIEALNKLKRVEPQGDPSLQNALEMSRGLLMNTPTHSTREVLIVFGALFTSDPGDIQKTITHLQKTAIRVRIIGLTAHVQICNEICEKTNFGDSKNSYWVILNEKHFKELFMDAVIPLAVAKSTTEKFTLVKMGFPSRVANFGTPTFCSCHSKLIYGGYICPSCKANICLLPTICPCCNLMLILSTHLARSYHHLFPLKLFSEIPVSKAYESTNCFGCQKSFPSKGVNSELVHEAEKHRQTADFITSSRYRCEDCRKDFCIDCDVFVHEVLHNCPGCEADNLRLDEE